MIGKTIIEVILVKLSSANLLQQLLNSFVYFECFMVGNHKLFKSRIQPHSLK
jgi:hypothetical protein